MTRLIQQVANHQSDRPRGGRSGSRKKKPCGRHKKNTFVGSCLDFNADDCSYFLLPESFRMTLMIDYNEISSH